MLGNNRLQLLPAWELKFGTIWPGHSHREGQTRPDYQNASELKMGPPRTLRRNSAPAYSEQRNASPNLGLDGYARIDFRLGYGTLYFIEANPNPEIAKARVRDGGTA